MNSKAIKWLATLLGCLSLIFVISAIAAPVNEKCPLSGNAISKDATYSVGFCCGNCQGKFSSDPAKSIAKVKAAPINNECPFSGDAIKATATYKGDLIGFCCNNCKGKFEKDAANLIKKVKVARTTVNDKCPLSGKAINPKKTYTVGFCCNNCSGKFKKDPVKNIAKVK
jgi:YHS domain-containing protein